MGLMEQGAPISKESQFGNSHSAPELPYGKGWGLHYNCSPLMIFLYPALAFPTRCTGEDQGCSLGNSLHAKPLSESAPEGPDLFLFLPARSFYSSLPIPLFIRFGFGVCYFHGTVREKNAGAFACGTLLRDTGRS